MSFWKALPGSLALLVASTALASGADAYVTLKGQVTFPKGPKPAEVDVKTDKDVCCKDGPLLSTVWMINPKTDGLKNVVVWLRPDNEDRTTTFPLDKIHPDLKTAKSVKHTIDQPKCQFEPRVLAAREGDTILVKNSANINHNVNYSSDEEAFNVMIKGGGEQSLKNPLKAQRSPISVKCDIHPWMSARVRVFDHPYFATTDADGKFEIKLVPAGKWRIVYWHEEGFHKGRDGLLGFPLEVKGDKPVVELEKLSFEPPSKS